MATQATSLTAALKQKLPGLQPKEIKDFAAAIAALQSHGLQVDQTFPHGITAPDAVTIAGNLDPKNLSQLGDIIKAAGAIKQVNVFPRGIPVQPDMMRVELTVHR